MPTRSLPPLARTLAGLALFVGLALLPTAQAAEPPTAPILRIEPGEHTAQITRIATDAAGRWLVTASHDKTARVWDLKDGRLVTTLRPPQGAGDEGKLYAVALSPDGGTVAVGGWSRSEDGYSSIYVFERASGRVLHRMGQQGKPGFGNVIQHLAFAPDGKVLASTWGLGSLRLFDAHSGKLLAATEDTGEDSYSVHFRADGRRLVTTSWDGQVRLYAWEGEGKEANGTPRLRLLTQRAAPGGQQPFAARFSPDGQRIAVGFEDTPAVALLEGDSLRPLASPDTAGVNKDLGSVAWSPDGAWLYAAGQAQRQWDGQWQNFIRRWSVAGDASDPQIGPPQDWPVAGSTLMDLAPLAAGRLAFGSGDPAWGVLETQGRAQGRRSLHHAPAVADLRAMWIHGRGLTLSADAAQVGFGYEAGGKAPAVFDSARRALLGDVPAGLEPPRLAAPGLEVTDWEDTPTPKLNGQPLKLKQYEWSRSLALRPDQAGESPGFVLGTEWRLRHFDRQGREVWQQPVPGIVWAVNVSRDDRWVVAAYGDGTIRWHRMSDGVEQLAFYPHPDRKRWVLWTPTGYFDASPGAEDLIGWHVNRGKDMAADFFPASRFRDRFRRPDVLARVLEAGGEAQALRLADAERGVRTQAVSIAQVLPPVLELLSPEEGAAVSRERVTLRYRVRTAADAPLTALRARVNGQAVETPRALKIVADDDGAREIEVPIPRADSLVQLFAENRHGVSTPVQVSLTWAGARESFEVKPKLYVLAVGVSKYARSDLNLGLAAKDARDFAAALARQKGRLYREVEVKLLTDAEATRDEVVDGLDWLQKQVGQRDVGMLFLAGHGVNDPAGGYFFLPHNAQTEKLKRTGVPMADIRSTLASLTGKSLFFVDTCHSGNVLGAGRRGAEADMNALVNELASAENGVVVFSSSTGREYALEDPKWGNGAFTKALLEGLGGKADMQGKGRITYKMLDFYVSERVKELTGGRQHPVTQAPGGVPDFPIAAGK